MSDFVKLESLLRDSADRYLSEAQLQPDPVLLAEGWERRFTADAQRAAEACELYRQLGFEVRAEPLQPDKSAEECEACCSSASSGFKTIYTRKKLF